MAPKIRAACERCGLEAVFERAGRFRDGDFIELLHDYFALEQELKYENACRRMLAERIAQLVAERAARVEHVDQDAEGCPF